MKLKNHIIDIKIICYILKRLKILFIFNQYLTSLLKPKKNLLIRTIIVYKSEQLFNILNILIIFFKTGL